MVDIYAGLERDERAMERLASATERIAAAAEERCKIERDRLDREFPPRHEPREAIVTRVQTNEDRLKASQGASSESLADWMELGPREKALVEKSSPKTSRTAQPKK